MKFYPCEIIIFDYLYNYILAVEQYLYQCSYVIFLFTELYFILIINNLILNVQKVRRLFELNKYHLFVLSPSK